MSRWLWLWLLLVLGLGYGLRWPDLARRPMHNDEAVNAIKFAALAERGEYKYDPHEYHGPTLHYFTLAWTRLIPGSGGSVSSETALRSTTAIFGLALIASTFLFLRGLGISACLWSALFLATSTSFVFYSRYYIHEILFVFFTAIAIGAGWRYWQTRSLGWAILCGTGIGLMHASKETFVFCLVAAAGALVANMAWGRWIDASSPPTRPPRLNWTHIALALLVWLGVALLFFSSFFTNAQGPMDSIRTYLPWLNRAGGASPHIQPWYFYFQRLLFFKAGNGPWWTEGGIALLALVGMAAGFIRRGLSDSSASLVRFLAFYTVALTAAYVLIPYKTPWCLLGFWHGAILLAGVGMAVLLELARTRLAKGAILGIGVILAGHLTWQSYRANNEFAADRRNPHVYAHTAADLLRLVTQVQSLSVASPDGDKTTIKVAGWEGDYWPLPYYLRTFSRVGYWDALPLDSPAPIMIVAARYEAHLDEKKTHLMTGFYELRPGVFLELYVELELWKKWLTLHPPKPDPE